MNTSSSQYDIAVIGAGPGGYVAAIRAAQLGFHVICIEEWRDAKGRLALGGTCLNVGCIPSKAMLVSSELYETTNHHLNIHGISVSKVSLDLDKMIQRKDSIVKKMTQGIEFLFKKNKITTMHGHARFVKAGQVLGIEVISGDGQTTTISASAAIIATGSKARQLPGIEVDNEYICDNIGALNWKTLPKNVGVIGAGVIGLELGSVWRRLGSNVKILEALPSFLQAADVSVQKEAVKIFAEQGLQIDLGVKIEQVKKTKEGLAVHYKASDSNAKVQVMKCDRLIVSVGRVPNTDDLGLSEIGIKLDERGLIPVDNHCRSVAPNVYAIGDVVRGPMLAHKAEDEGVMVAELLASQKPHIDYNTIPWVIYTSPELAWVGQTEQSLQAEGRSIQSGTFYFKANGRALGVNHAQGFIKMIADTKTDEILGVHIIGAQASDLIAEAVLALEFKASAEDIARACHPHPSFSEVMREAALGVHKRSINA